MNKNWTIAVAVVFILAVGAFWYFGGVRPAVTSAPDTVRFDPLNTTYLVDNRPVTLVNGKAEEPAAPGSVVTVTTAVFGEPVMGDLNADGKPDALVVLTVQSGGSGTFYYAAAAMNTDAGTLGTNAVFLGDRIAPQTSEVKDGQITVNYAERKPDEPMTAQPSVGVSKYLYLNGATLTEGKVAIFGCESEQWILAVFHPGNDAEVQLALSDGRTLSVPHAISASGARYANADESFVFWNKGDTAFITEKNTQTFSGCLLK